MNRFLLALSRTFIIALVTSVVIAAVVVGIGRQFLTHVHEAHPNIESYVSDTTGLVVRFDNIHGQWRKLTPKLSIGGLSLKKDEASDPFLSIKGVSAEINLGNSFLYMRPIIKLWVDGLDIEVVYSNGGFVVKNAPEIQSQDQQKPESSSQLVNQIDFLLKQPLLEVSNSHIVIKDFWQHEVLVSDINVGMARFGVNKRFWADLVLEGDTDISLNMMGDVKGRFTDPESLHGSLYAKLNAPDLATWLPIPVKQLTAFNVLDAKGEVEVWGKLNAGELERVTSRLQLADVIIEKENSEIHPPQLKELTGVVKWEGNLSEDWVVGFDHLKILSDEFTWSPEHLVIRSDKQGSKGRRYKGRIDNATLAPWVQYYASFLDPESQTCDTLQTVQPDAQLDDILFTIQADGAQVTDFQVMANASNITTRPKRWIPGVNNVSAKLLLGKSESIVYLQGNAVDLEYPALFRENLLIDELKGALLIKNNEEELRIESGLIEVNDEQLKAVTQLAVIKDKQSDTSPYLRLQATLRDIDLGKDLYAHLPVGVIPEGVNNWIDGAVKAGRLLQGDLLFHGPVNLTEFEPFQTILGFTVEQADLVYLEGWKPVTGITADIGIYNGIVDAWAVDGQYYGGQINATQVGTRQTDRGVELFVDADVNGKVEDLIAILSDSPIQDATAPIMETIGVQGDGQVAVDIVVPLHQAEGEEEPALSLAVGVDVSNGQFEVKDNEKATGNSLVIKDLKGRVNYDLKEGLSSPGVEGLLFDGPVNATIETIWNEDVADTVISAQGNTRMQALKPWLDLDILQPLEGPLAYQAKVHLASENSEAGRGSFVEVTSDLVNIKSPYPVPFAKSAGEKWPFRYMTTLGDEVNYQEIVLNEFLDMKMEFKEKKLHRGAVAFYENASLPETEHFTVAGLLESIDVDAWVDMLNHAEADSDAVEQEPEQGVNHLVEKIGKSHLFIKQLDVAGQRFDSVTTSLQPKDGEFHFDIKSPQVKATVKLPMGYITASEYRNVLDPIDIKIKQLSVSIPEQGIEPETTSDDEPRSPIDPRFLPEIVLDIEKLKLSGEKFGHWKAHLMPKKDGVKLHHLYFDFRSVEFNGGGEWLWKNGKPKTHIHGKAIAKDVADILSDWGYAKSINSDTAQTTLKADWAGAPFEFDLMETDAELSVVIKDGKFRDVSSGTADKVLGFFHFEDWLSKMSLKIDELDSDEMPYRVIRGDIKLRDKVLSTKDLSVESVAISMAMKGSLNIEKKSIDAQLDVTIPVTRNLVLPAAAVGGLPAAATVYVIEKVLGSQLDKLTTMEYSVQGDVNNPEVNLKDSFNIIPRTIEKSIVANGEGTKEKAKDKPKEKSSPKEKAKPKPKSKKETPNKKKAELEKQVDKSMNVNAPAESGLQADTADSSELANETNQ